MSTNHTNHTNEVACPRLRDRGGSVISTAKDTKKAGPLRGPEWLYQALMKVTLGFPRLGFFDSMG